MPDMELAKIQPQEIWVDIFEAAELTGYNYESMRSVVKRIAKQPEDGREIRMRKRTSRWELWLPDVYAYLDKPGRGPKHKNSDNESS